MIPEVPFWMPLFFVVLAVTLCTTFVWALKLADPDNKKRPWLGAGIAFGWLALTGLLAAAGILQDFDSRPPPMAIVLISMNLLCLGIVFSSWGKGLAEEVSFSALIGVQAFRLPLELVMHQAADYGLMPPQMSYSGRNFDIITGLSALVLAIVLKRNPALSRGWIWVWNFLGLALLFNVVTVAILSFPLPFRVFMNEPANIWVTHFPYIWLPAIMVAAAFLGHLTIFRKLFTS